MPLQVGLRRAALLGDTQRVSRVMMWARTLPAEHTDSGCSVGSTALGSASLFCVSHSGGFGWITFVTELINFHLDLSNGFYFVFVSSLVPLSFLLTLEAKKPPKTTNQTNKQKKKNTIPGMLSFLVKFFNVSPSSSSPSLLHGVLDFCLVHIYLCHSWP